MSYIWDHYVTLLFFVMTDECAVNNGNCSQFARCSNVPGGYECSCLAGFTGSGFDCKTLATRAYVLCWI